MVSYQFTDRLAIGGGPVITSSTDNFAPAFFAPTPGPLGLPTFPSATNSHPFWGAGFQLGLLYEVNDDWNVGFSYKSPIWQQRWEYNASYSGQIRTADQPAGFAPRDLLVGRCLQGAAEGPDRRRSSLYRLRQYRALRPERGQRRARLARRLRGGHRRAVRADRAADAPRRLPLQHQPDPSAGDSLQRAGPRDHPDTRFRWVPRMPSPRTSRSRSPGCTRSTIRSRARSSRSPGRRCSLTSQVDSIVVGLNMSFGGTQEEDGRHS